MKRAFYMTEVFSEAPYGGNQLATVIDSDGLSSDEMQKIARAFNFAETTFLLGGSVACGYDVRIFTPAEELPFAGHPTLGTCFVIREVLLKKSVDSLTLNLGVGPITVKFEQDVLWMRQNEPEFGDVVDRAKVAAELGLLEEQIDEGFPCQYVSTGLEFLLVPMVSYDALEQAQQMSSELASGYLLFCRGGYNEDQQIQARMFANTLGVPEDPATGSANGCLAAYLAEHAYINSRSKNTGAIDICVGQGYEIARPSQLYLRSLKSEDEFVVEVGGKVRLIADGEWLLQSSSD